MHRSAIISPLATWAVAAAGLCLLAWDFRFRLDLTDEAFSIQDALFPDDQLSAVRFHWIVTRPLLLAVGGDIYLFRLAGAMMLMAAGALLGSGLSRLALRGHRNRAVSWTLSGLGATLALGHYGFDLRSPGYNWLITLLSVMVAASIVHSAVTASRGRWILAGGALAGLAVLPKASSGLLIAGLGAAAVAFLPPLRSRFVTRRVLLWVVGVMSGIVVGVLATLMWGNPLASVESGFRVLKHLTIYDGIVGRAFEESITFLRQAFHHQWPTWAVALVAGIVVARKPKWSGAAVAVALPMVTIVAGVRFVAPRGGPEWPSASNTLVEPLIVACLAFGPALCIGRRGGAADRSGHVAILSFLAVLPMATAFGTGNFPYWTLAGLTAIAWSCAAVMLAMLLCASRGGLRLLMMSVPLVAAASLATTIVQLDRTPWRSPAEPSGRFAACDLGSLGTLMLDESLAADIRGLRATCAAAGLSAGDDVLAFFDMPGIPLVLGARAPGASWIISGYPASDAAALVVLGSVPMPRRAAAWVLIRTPALAAATNGEGRNPDVGTLLRNVGVDFPSSHRFVSAVPFHMWDKTVVIEIWRPAAGHS